MVNRLSYQQKLLAILLGLIFLRLISLALYPLYDTTEARYGEIARIMYETGNWLTPHFNYELPFWGKPPLHTWITAGGFALLGESEFAGRLPHFLTGLLTLVIFYSFVKTFLTRKQAILSIIVLASCLGFIVASGMIMTDTLLLFSMTLAMTSMWRFSQGFKKSGYVFFFALSIGLLAKGPVAIVLVGIAVCVWSVATKQLVDFIVKLPWLAGFAIIGAVAVPWYVLAEQATPGFIEYFLLGEHFYRFVEPGWQGDLYGTAHTEPKGMIWLYWLAAAFPWSFVLLFALARKNKSAQFLTMDKNKFWFALAWMLSPMILFTMAGNILPIYVMPGFGGLALLICLLYKEESRVGYFSAVTFVLMVLTVGYVSSGAASKVSEKDILYVTKEQPATPIVYWKTLPFSGQYYSQGKAVKVKNLSELNKVKSDSGKIFFVASKKADKDVTPYLQRSCNLLVEHRKRSLFECFI